METKKESCCLELEMNAINLFKHVKLCIGKNGLSIGNLGSSETINTLVVNFALLSMAFKLRCCFVFCECGFYDKVLSSNEYEILYFR